MSALSDRPILIVHASVGGGHTRAAQAVAEALTARGARSIVMADYNDLVPAWQRIPVQALYRFALGRVPALWRAYYRMTNRPRPTLAARALASAGVAATERLLAEVAPALVISTFSGAAALVGAARARLGQAFPHLVVTTDFHPHRHWVRDGVDHWFAASEAARHDLIALGADAARVSAPGFPVRAAVATASRAGARAELAAHFGLDQRPIIAVAAGAQPTARSPRIVAALAGLRVPAQVLVCFDAPLPRGAAGVRFVGVGLGERFAEVLAGCDLLVGKSGGATVAEVCALGRALLVVDPYPGQEEDNAAWLEGAGAALQVRRLDDLAACVDDLVAAFARRAALATAARRLARPRAAADIAAHALALLETSPAARVAA